MTLTRLYALTGAVWGLFIGALVGYGAMAVAAGASWLYLFGDSPWPASVEWIILASGGFTFAAAFVGCLWAGLRHGRAAERAGAKVAQVQRRRGVQLLGLGLGLILLLAAGLGAQTYMQDRARQTAAEQTAWFRHEVEGRQWLVSVRVKPAESGVAFDMSITIRGQHAGAHSASWRIRSSTYNAVLAEGKAELELTRGENRAALEVDAFDLIGKYHEVALDNADADVEVAESFRLEISLTPVLGDEDLARMPPHEAHSLSLGQSDLIETGSFAFPAHFRISGPEYELME